MEVFADGVQGSECYSETCDCLRLRCFRVFERKAHLQKRKDLKACLPQYGVKALEEKTQLISLFLHSDVKVTEVQR